MKSVSITLEQLLRSKQSKTRTPILGERELDVMKSLWSDGTLSAQQVLQASGGELNLSLSTIQSTLERLYRKELVNREKNGRYYIYSAVVSKNTIISQLLGDIAEHFGEGDAKPLISGFITFLNSENYKEGSALPSSVLKAMASEATDFDE